jgi:hypothetical protein
VSVGLALIQPPLFSAAEVQAGSPPSANYWLEALVATVLAQMAFFIWHAARNGTRLGWRRPLWIVGILFASWLVTPAYWWLYAQSTSRRAGGGSAA